MSSRGKCIFRVLSTDIRIYYYYYFFFSFRGKIGKKLEEGEKFERSGFVVLW